MILSARRKVIPYDHSLNVYFFKVTVLVWKRMYAQKLKLNVIYL